MVFITEQQLDDAASAIQDDETINESLVTELSEIQPAVFAFLFTENTFIQYVLNLLYDSSTNTSS